MIGKWTDEEVEQLRRWWEDSQMSAVEISQRLGTHSAKGVSKKATALGLAPHVRVKPRHKLKPLVFGVSGPPRQPELALIDLPYKPGEPYPVFPAVTILTVKTRQCRWPVGRPMTPMRMCGHRTHKDTPWCPSHYRRAHVSGTLP